MKRCILIASLLSWSVLSTASANTVEGHNHEDHKSHNLCDGFVPENDWYIPVGMESEGGITQAQFNAVLDAAEKTYAAIFRSMGLQLKVERNWEDGTVNAYAQQVGNLATIHMFGGLARHETITPDGFLLVACHEIGHHLAGAPKKLSSAGDRRWASNEGQSDYWATMNCFKRVLRYAKNFNALRNIDVDSLVYRACRSSYRKSKTFAAICIRGAMAGKSVAELFRALRNMETPVLFSTPDSAVVSTTFHSHPQPQCRLDTYFQGAICAKPYWEETSNDNPEVGTCNRSHGHRYGVRPLCWYNPRNHFDVFLAGYSN